MELKEIQKKVTEIFNKNLKRDNIQCTDDYLILKLGEEVGEVIQSYLIFKKKCRPEKCQGDETSKKEFSEEIADVMGLLFSIADNFDIDLEKAIKSKWISILKRQEKEKNEKEIFI